MKPFVFQSSRLRRLVGGTLAAGTLATLPTAANAADITFTGDYTGPASGVGWNLTSRLKLGYSTGKTNRRRHQECQPRQPDSH